MFFWVTDDLSQPPTSDTVKRRRPVGASYWESSAFEKGEALHQLRDKWMRITGERCANPKSKTSPNGGPIRELNGGRRCGVDADINKDDA